MPIQTVHDDRLHFIIIGFLLLIGYFIEKYHKLDHRNFYYGGNDSEYQKIVRQIKILYKINEVYWNGVISGRLSKSIHIVIKQN